MDAKTVTLKDGSEVVVRPTQEDDLERSLAFFRGLPPEDREYLRGDVTQRRVVERRFRSLKAGHVKRIVAVVDDEIVAEGALELAGHSWSAHVGEIRLIVGRPYQRKGLGMLMARELYLLAASEKLEQIVVTMMRPQLGAQSIFRKLGFRESAVLPELGKDLSGRHQDLIMMQCNLDALWKELETLFTHTDWSRTR
jgi:L-amino acid N-acyltransferase YncA